MATAKKPQTLKVGTIVATDSIAFRAAARRGSMYDTIFATMGKLGAGQSFIVPIPKGTDVRTMHNRMSAAIRRGPVQPPTGCTFHKRTTDKGEIAVACEKNGNTPKPVTAAKGAAKAKKAGKKRAKKTTAPAAAATVAQ